VDIVIVTRATDAHLLRFLLASYECFWEGGNRLVLFTRRSDDYLWEDIRLPAGTRLVYQEDFPDLGADDPRDQLYLKLIAHQFVETEYFFLMDSDYLFVAPCPKDAFFCHDKPIWFRRPWDDVTLRWREGSEAFVGASIDHLYMSEPQFVFSKNIAAELCRRYDLRRILKMDGVSEYVVYGWFARQFFADSYHWVDLPEGDTVPVGWWVNQIPPSYCELDPKVSLDDFPNARYVVFWSHWDLADAKMTEFLVEARRRYPGRPLHLPDMSLIYPLIQLPASTQALYYNIPGLYSDGWVKDDVWFSVGGGAAISRMRIEFNIPQGPLTGTWQLGCGPQKEFRLDAGLAELTIPLDTESARHSILLRFDSIESGGETDSTGRRLRARLLSVSLGGEGLMGTTEDLLLQLREAVASGEKQRQRSELLESAAQERLEQLQEKDRALDELRSQLEASVASGEEQRQRSELLESAAQERLEQLQEKDRALDELRSQLEASVASGEEQRQRSELLERAAQERLEQLQEKDRALDELRSQLEASVASGEAQRQRSELLESAAQERLEQLQEKDKALDELRSQLEASVASGEEQRKQVAQFKQVVKDNQERISQLELTRDQLTQKADALKKRVLRLENESWLDMLRRRLGS
jgi:hypothetical protein